MYEVRGVRFPSFSSYWLLQDLNRRTLIFRECIQIPELMHYLKARTRPGFPSPESRGPCTLLKSTVLLSLLTPPPLGPLLTPPPLGPLLSPDLLASGWLGVETRSPSDPAGRGGGHTQMLFSLPKHVDY